MAIGTYDFTLSYFPLQGTDATSFRKEAYYIGFIAAFQMIKVHYKIRIIFAAVYARRFFLNIAYQVVNVLAISLVSL